MRQIMLRLDSPEQVQSFVKAISILNGDFEILCGRHILDARSLMGLFSLDLSHPILLKAYNDCAENMAALAPYLSEEENDYGS